MTERCLACDLIAGDRPLPGGRVHATETWVVEHCIGPLGVGTLLVKPFRHCTGVADLTPQEAQELGPLLHAVSACVNALNQAEQVYVCLWSHAGWTPGHIHFLVQPAWRHQAASFTAPGPTLQSEMFFANRPPDPEGVAAFCEQARRFLASRSLRAGARVPRFAERGLVKHRDSIQSEFKRQAESFAASPVLAAPEITDRIGAALRAFEARSVLDLACGPGVLLPTLAGPGRCVVGLDLTSETLRVARRSAAHGKPSLVAHGKPSLVQGDAEHVPFATASFDGVVLRLAIHHMSRPAAVLTEARRVLRASGRLLVLDILTSTEPETAALHNAIERLRDPSHAACVPAAKLERSITAAGFCVLAREVWSMPRRYGEWAAIIADSVRMDSLELVLRHLARAGIGAGVELREEGAELCFTYTWTFIVAEPARTLDDG